MKTQFFTLLLLISFVTPGFSSDGLLILENHLQNYNKLSGQFTQIISSQTSNNTNSSTGEFWIKKPNKFRWHYSSPYIQEIISNGEKVWVYDEDLEQVSIKNSSQSVDSSPLAIILGSASLGDSFEVSPIKNDDLLEWLKLTPKNDSSGFEYISIGFENGILARMIMADNFGQTTHLLFTDVAVHSNMDDTLFEFQTPNGADVFDETIEQ
ncbi:MAG: outer membrane lipoprotein chaperone LolA [Cycloclasticus sp.]